MGGKVFGAFVAVVEFGHQRGELGVFVVVGVAQQRGNERLRLARIAQFVDGEAGQFEQRLRLGRVDVKRFVKAVRRRFHLIEVAFDFGAQHPGGRQLRRAAGGAFGVFKGATMLPARVEAQRQVVVDLRVVGGGAGGRLIQALRHRPVALAARDERLLQDEPEVGGHGFSWRISTTAPSRARRWGLRPIGAGG